MSGEQLEGSPEKKKDKRLLVLFAFGLFAARL